MKRTVYIISGPPGAGKSTTSRMIANLLPISAYIEGDLINHMVIGGYEKPWLSTFHRELIWLNIASLTENFVSHDHDVVIDYVAFKENVDYLVGILDKLDIVVKYVVLLVDEIELIRRDKQRIPEDQMGERSLIVLREFLESIPPKNNILNTTNIEAEQVANDIINSTQYIIKK